MHRAARVCMRQTGARSQVRAGEPVVPGQFVFVPVGPCEAQEKAPRGKCVTQAAQKQLFWCGRLTRKPDEVKIAKHHARGRAAENREEREVLEIEERKRRGVHGGVELAESKLASERTEECQEAAIREQQKCDVNQRGQAPLRERGHGKERRNRRLRRWVRYRIRLVRFRIRRNGDVNLHATLLKRVT